MRSYGSFLPSVSPVVKHLIIINFIIWLAIILFPDKLGTALINYCALHYWESDLFNPAQLVTYMFIHDPRSIAHLGFNMFTLYMFGVWVESELGSKRFLVYFMACGILAALFQEIVQTGLFHFYNGQIVAHGADNPVTAQNQMTKMAIIYYGYTIGASGAIYGVLLAYGMLFPYYKVRLLFPPVELEARYLVIIWGVTELLLSVVGAKDGVAHLCHLTGMLGGFLLLKWWMKRGEVRRRPRF